MANYPEWVLKYKEKGTYINVQNGKYYLYAAHSERIHGTNKVRRVSDGYLGRITEENGFIPAKRKLSEPVHVYEYGLSETILLLCDDIRRGLRREFGAKGDYVMTGGLLLFIYGEVHPVFFESLWLSTHMTELCMENEPTLKQRVGMERVLRMITDRLQKHFGDEYDRAISLLPLVKVVCMGNDKNMAVIPKEVKDFCGQHGLDMKEESYV